MNNRYPTFNLLRRAHTAFLLGGLCLGNLANAQDCPAATISYGSPTICMNEGSIGVARNGSSGGSFSAGNGLTIDASTGAINPYTSQAGTYTVTYSIPAAGSCPAVNAQTTVTLQMSPVVTPIGNIGVCAGTTVSLPAFSSNLQDVTYSWTNDNTSIGLAASGTGNLPSFTAVNNTSALQVAFIRVMATSTQNGSTCMSRPMVFRISVNPTPTVNAVSNQTYCDGQTVPSTAFTSPSNSSYLRYYWTNSDPSIGLASSGYGDLPSFTAYNVSGAPKTATITVTPQFINGAKCAGPSTSYTITVNTSNAGTASFSYAGSPYCPSGTVTPTFSGPTGGTFSSTPGLVITGAGAVNTSLSRPGTYTVTYRYAGGTGCSLANTATITILSADASFSYAQPAYCGGVNGGTVTPQITGTTGGTFSAAAGLSIDPATGVINLANSQKGSYTVSYSVNTPSCGLVTVATTVNIVNTPVVEPLSNIRVCDGATIPNLNFTSSNEPGATITWTNSNTAIGLPAAGVGDISSFVAQNGTNDVVTSYIAVRATMTTAQVTCPGPLRTFLIQVRPVPTVNPVSNQSVCLSAGQTSAISFSNTTGSNTGVTYRWTNNNTAIGLAASGTGDLPAFTPSAGVANISVTATNSFGCTSAPRSFAYLVNNCGTTPNLNGNPGNQRRAITQTDAPAAESTLDATPNPVRSNVRVATTEREPVTLRVIDLGGTVHKVVRGVTGATSLDLSGLKPGTYILQSVNERKGSVGQRTIIKL